MNTKIEVTLLDQELVDALNEKKEEACMLLNISNDDLPKEVVKKINEYVDTLLSEQYTPEDLKEYALQLGSLWGFMVEKEYQWQWKYIDFGDEIRGIYLVSPQDLFCCPPLYFLNNILQGDNAGLDGKNDNTVMLLFNMLDGIENKKTEKKYQVVC